MLIGRAVATRFLASACESCVYCLKGLQSSCPHQKNVPKHYQGTFQQYMTVPKSCLLQLPEGVLENELDPSKFCAGLCSGSAALRALSTCQHQPGDVVVVVGIAGGIGHLVGAIAKQVMGLKVIGLDWQWKLDALPVDSSRHIADVLIPALEAKSAPCSARSIENKSRLIGICAELRGEELLPLGPNAVIVTATGQEGFLDLHNYVCDGGKIICVG